VTFWHEVYVELRRHAGDERLPEGLRSSLRGLARRAYARAERLQARSERTYSRRQLREAGPARVPADVEATARAEARTAGIDLAAPFAAVEVRNRPDVMYDALDVLAHAGLTVVRIGGGPRDPVRARSLVDVTASMGRAPALERVLIARARLVVCGGAELQRMCCEADVPSLTLNAVDPFAFYPVRPNGLYLQRTVIDLDSGRVIPRDRQLTEAFFRNRRNQGSKEHTSHDIAAAVAELLDGAAHGWRDTPAQARYREELCAAAARLAPVVRYVAQHGPDDGFLGDGRLAGVQAERTS
jgi:hypothetical protein